MIDLARNKPAEKKAKDSSIAAVKQTKRVKVQARMEESLKQSAEEVFEKLGVSPTEAIRIFYTQVSIQRGFPFELKLPNETTLAALEETKTPNELETCNDLNEFFDSL